jgi:DNA invertase Pin-like site-specific DNA recombinase
MKTSIPEQLLAIRKYADRHGYEIIEEISESVSGRKHDTDRLERLRDLYESGKIKATLVCKWNRMGRTVARFESLMLEMKLAGVDIVGLDGQSNATATGRMFNRIMAVFSEYQRGDLIETLAQGRRGLARAGKNMAS